MDVLIPVFSIVITTCIMILAVYFRVKSRELARHFEFDFTQDGNAWKVVIAKSQYAFLLVARFKIVPAAPPGFAPKWAAVLKKNGKGVLTLPNFWSKSKGVAITIPKKSDNLTMLAEVTLKDPPMTRTFIKSLEIGGITPYQLSREHNKVTFAFFL